MAAFDYSEARGVAEELIGDFGQSATLVQMANSGTQYNPTLVETAHTVTLALVNYRDSQVDGSLILAGDKLVYLSTQGLAVTPDAKDKIEIAGERHEIVNLDALSPAGTVVYWQLQVRK